jgi:diguanylate cyclase (GGDEF)-like protein/PAS domain S-box-containing protein
MDRPLCLLVIEGSAEDRPLHAHELARELPGFELHVVTDRAGFAQALAADGFDLVVCDFRPSWTDGLGVLREVKALYAHCPVLLVVDHADEPRALAAMDNGLDYCVLKSPAYLRHIAVAVYDALARREERRAVLEAAKRYQQLFERVPVGLYRVLPDGTFLDANPALAEIFGCPDVATLRQYRATDFFVSARNEAKWRGRVRESDGAFASEGPARRLDGDVIWVRNRVRVVHDGDRELYYEGAIADITDRRRIEEYLRREKELSDGVINSLPGVFYIFSHESRLVRWNQNLERITGYTAEKLAGMRASDFLAPEDWEAVKTRVRETQARGTVQVEAHLRACDGALTPYFFTAVRILLDDRPCLIGTGMDISTRVRAEAALRASETQLRAIIDTEPEGVALLGPDGTVVEMNAAGLVMLGARGADEVIGRSIYSSVSPPYRELFREFNERVVRGEGGVLEFEITDLHGDRRWVEIHSVPILRPDGIVYALGIARDITAQRHTQERLSYLAHHDPLTDLPNRTLFYDRLQRAMIDADRRSRLVVVMYLDLDRFKTINDTLGHDAGDVLLKLVADRLRAAVRQGDSVARLSGDEFAIALSDLGHMEDAARLAQKILDVFVPPFRIREREFYITPSIGVTIYPFDDSTVEGMLKNADVAMYRAKDRGRNNYQFYTAEMTVKAFERLSIENALRGALARSEFDLHYQPIARCGDGGIIAFEVLLRWSLPDRGPVSPEVFVPVAEETGLIVPIGEWVLRAATAQLARWHNAGFTSVRLAVNLSARQFQQPGLSLVVARALRDAGVRAQDLELEITESVLMHEVEHTAKTLLELTEMGVSLSVDDFGTGYSSLSYVKRFPVDTLKIDRSFVRDIPGDADDAAIASAIIAMAHSLGLTVIAEGVETAQQLAFLREHGCDALQGYLLSRPIPADAATALLQRAPGLAAVGQP